MPKRFFRNLLGLLMIATMLATSIIPPGIRHTHAGGNDLSHGHNNDLNSVLCRTTADECLENCRPSQNSLFDGFTVENSLGDETTHRHFQFFGFSVALPDTNHPPKSGADSANNQFASVLATEDISTVTQSNLDARNLLVPISQDYSPHAVVVLSAISNSLQSVTPTLLCDRARHERSGVQLI